MSRTAAHRPYRAYFADPRACRPVHDHRHGGCDLLPLTAFFAALRAGQDLWRTHRCHWTVVDRAAFSCGCPVCTRRHERRFERRRDRRTARLALQRVDVDTLAGVHCAHAR